MATKRQESAMAKWVGVAALCAAALLLGLPLSGCAKSSSSRWAQNSAVIAPSERPPALSAFSTLSVYRKVEEQVQ